MSTYLGLREVVGGALRSAGGRADGEPIDNHRRGARPASSGPWRSLASESPPSTTAWVEVRDGADGQPFLEVWASQAVRWYGHLPAAEWRWLSDGEIGSGV